jgi:hypothetical protein
MKWEASEVIKKSKNGKRRWSEWSDYKEWWEWMERRAQRERGKWQQRHDSVAATIDNHARILPEKVLARRYDLQPLALLTNVAVLKPSWEVPDVLWREDWVLARDFLPSPPPRVPKQIHVGPETIQTNKIKITQPQQQSRMGSVAEAVTQVWHEGSVVLAVIVKPPV